MHICTTCDHKYIHKGLALYESLKNTIAGDFTLHWLCIDDVIYYKILNLRLPGIKPYNLTYLEYGCSELRVAKKNPPSNYGDAYSQYCWTLTPWFIDYLLTQEKVGPLLYADSDIYFYNWPALIARAVGEKGVGIHTHRFSGRMEDFTGDNGWFNVGVMYFNNTLPGINIANTWKNWLLHTSNPFYKTHGTCGDQKYVELWPSLFGEQNICVFDKGFNAGHDLISHQAPWCAEKERHAITVFYHFSHFNFDLEKNTWSDHLNQTPEWQPASSPEIRTLYERYFEAMKRADVLLKSSTTPYNEKQADENKEFAMDEIRENVEVKDGEQQIDSSKVLEILEKKGYVAIEKPEAVAAIYMPKILPDFIIDIIGNIKVDESNPDRVKMLIASIRSLTFMAPVAQFRLLLEGASQRLLHRVRCELTNAGFDFILLSASFGSYGKSSTMLLKPATAPYVLNFLEDHFCMLDDLGELTAMLAVMKKFDVDVLKTSFFKVEQKCTIANIELTLFYQGPEGYIFDKDVVSHKRYEKPYGQRYFTTVHFLSTRAFVLKFFNRDLGVRPHEYEHAVATPGWEHRVMIPGTEFLCSIDDPHGEENSNLLDRPDAKKFWDIYNTL